MNRQLVVNADDFGMTAGVSRGIARAYDEGLVTSASLLANLTGFEEAVKIAHARPGMSVGLHLNLTDGSPVSPADQVRSLVDDRGRFHGYRAFSLRLLSGRIVRSELRREIDAQFERLERAGIQPSHVDGHRHIHLLPLLFDAVAAAAEQRGVRTVRCPAGLGGRAAPAGIASARELGFIGFGRLHYGRLADRGLQTADCFLGAGFRSRGDLEDAVGRLADLPAGLTEWMVHPGEVDAELIFCDDYLQKREEELEFLCSKEAAEAVEAAGLKLVNFHREPKLRVSAGASQRVA
ncbi:MAG: ChbG/HpnK family deacetylase [Deltaproteobacteria bacterium]|nr:ChbG/HpnK family deacetylase [Deltaproteobacteria bacterium]